jgi:hypothetical protein
VATSVIEIESVAVRIWVKERVGESVSAMLSVAERTNAWAARVATSEKEMVSVQLRT